MPKPVVLTEQLPTLRLPCRSEEDKLKPVDHNEVEVMEIAIPMHVFAESATSFRQWNDDCLNFKDDYQLLLQLMFYLHHNPSRAGTGGSRLFFEKVVHRDDQSKVVAMRVRLTHSTGTTMGESLYTLFEVVNPKRKVKQHMFEFATSRHWQNLCFKFNPNLTRALDTAALDCVNMPSSAFNPASVFTVDLSHAVCMGLEADLRQCQIHNYYELDDYNPDIRQRMRYAFPQLVYEARYLELSPTNFERYDFPFVEQQEITENVERTIYQKMFNLPAELADPNNKFLLEKDALDHTPGVKRKSADECYDEQVHVKRNRSSNLSLDSLKELMRTHWRLATDLNSNVTELKGLFGKPSEENRLRCLELIELIDAQQTRIEMEGIQMFKKLFNKDGDMPEPVQKVAEYFWQYMKDNNGDLRLPQFRQVSNLTPFHQWLATFAMQLEIIFGVNTAHREITSCYISALQVYFRTAFHCHGLFTGPPAAGKTFTLKQLYDFLIEGSAKMLTYSTPKAKTVFCNSFGCSIEIYQEVTPSQLGGEQGKTKGKAGTTNNTDTESILKTQLTEGETTVQSMGFVDGQRTLFEHKVDTNCVMFMATNAEAHEIASAMLSRLNHIRWLQQDRTDNGGLAAADARPKDEELMNAVTRDLRRNQMLACIAGLMVDCRILPQISMHVAQALYSKFREYGKQLHLQNVDETRHRQRFEFLVQSLVTLRSIKTVFDCRPVDEVHSPSNPLSPVDGKSFQFEHMLELKKHMYAKVEDCVFAFGLLSHQYEDPIMYHVLEAIRKELLYDLPVGDPKAIEAIEHISHAPEVTQHVLDLDTNGTLKAANPCGSRVQVFGDYAWTDLTLNSRQQDNRSNDELKALAEYLLSKMTAKPQFGDVLNVLSRLAQSNSIKPALVYSNNRLQVSMEALKANTTNKVKYILGAILNHQGERSAEYLYGRAREGSAPFIYDSIVVKPAADAKPLQLKCSDYCEPGVRSFLAETMREMEKCTMSDLANTVLTIPLDDYGYQQRQRVLLMPPAKLKSNPPSNPRDYARWIETCLDPRHYPSAFAQSDVKQYCMKMEELARNIDDCNWTNVRGELFTELYDLDADNNSNHDRAGSVCTTENDPFSDNIHDEDMVDYDSGSDSDVPNAPEDPAELQISALIAQRIKDRAAL